MIDALMTEARAALAAGQPGAAIRLLGDALAEAPEARARIAPMLATLLMRIAPSRYHPRLDADLCACLAEPTVDPQPLARVTAALLLHKYPGLDLAAAAGDALWLGFLDRCINTDAAMEARLAAMRRALAARGAPMDEALRKLACALARQCFASEYAIPVAPGEDLPADTGTVEGVLAAALYRPVSEIAGGEGLLARAEPRAPIAELLRTTCEEPARERALAAAIDVLPGSTADPVSAAVRAQYEANPYPRWRAPPASAPVELRALLARLPGVRAGDLPEGAPRVLIAGCGTGYEAIDIARMDADAAVTALDLSRASLAYGRRMAGELGVANIRFLQGDILALPRSGLAFDFASSTGVLHHMDDPAAGLAALAAVVAPGGILRIALYSHRARALVREAQALIAARGWPPTPDGIRALRAHVLSLPDGAPLAALRQSEDFYSLSGCRDLLFHVREHAFRPLEIAALVEGAGLALLAIDAPPQARDRFRAMHGPAADPHDMALWDSVEAADPHLFAGMFHLWCRKPGLRPPSASA